MASKNTLLVHHFLSFFFFFALTTLFSVNQRQNNFNIKGFLHNINKKKDLRTDLSNAVGIQI